MFANFLSFLLILGWVWVLGDPALSRAVFGGQECPQGFLLLCSSILGAATLISTKMGKSLLLSLKFWRKNYIFGVFLRNFFEVFDSCCGSKRWDISRTFTKGVIPRVHHPSKPFWGEQSHLRECWRKRDPARVGIFAFDKGWGGLNLIRRLNIILDIILYFIYYILYYIWYFLLYIL